MSIIEIPYKARERARKQHDVLLFKGKPIFFVDYRLTRFLARTNACEMKVEIYAGKLYTF